MVVVGADVHKRTHTFVAVDRVGRELDSKTFDASTAGHQAAVVWARQKFGDELTWAIEDCRHLSASLERDLLTAGQKVVRVLPKMMAEQRRVARTRGKSDPTTRWRLRTQHGATEHQGVRDLPELVSPTYRNRVRKLSPRNRTPGVQHEPEPHTSWRGANGYQNGYQAKIYDHGKWL